MLLEVLAPQVDFDQVMCDATYFFLIKKVFKKNKKYKNYTCGV